MDKNVTVTTFPIWKNAGPSTVDKPTIEKETRSEEDLDLPWQVVVHNDPVNLMSYVTMVFQRVFGYPREKAERHMLEVHHNGRSILWSGCGNARNFMCSSCMVISCSPHSKKPVDMEICRRNDEIEISELDPFLAELLRQIPVSADPEGTPAAEKRLFSPPTSGTETEICAEWKLYVEPELRRLF